MHVTHPSSTFQWAAYQAAIARPTPLKTRRISKHSRDAQKKNTRSDGNCGLPTLGQRVFDILKSKTVERNLLGFIKSGWLAWRWKIWAKCSSILMLGVDP